MTIWLHITASYFWSRPPVGVIRVERELFAALDRLGEAQLRYCIFVHGELYEVDRAALDSNPVATEPPKPVKPWAIMRTAMWEGLKATIYALARESRRVDSALEWVQSVRRQQAHRRIRRPRLPVAEIAPGDTFLTVGIDATLDYATLFDTVANRNGARIVGFCHDIIPVLFPEFCGRGSKAEMSAYFAALIRASALLFCNSAATRDDLLDFAEDHGLNPPPMAVVPLGCSLPAEGKLMPHERAQFPEGDYALFVSTIERRKNHRLLYDVYAEMADDPEFDRLPTICLVGMHGWRVTDLLEDIALNEKVRGKFVFLTQVSDAMLARLYRDALFCVYPSHYEGWGLPVSEALALGKAVIASDAGALPEASGGCALHLSPYDTRAWRDAIVRMARDPDWRGAWEQRARRDFRHHDWDHAARIVIDTGTLLAVCPCRDHARDQSLRPQPQMCYCGE